MFFTFFKYFFVYLLRAKTRQRLLFLAIVGLVISSFALLVLQSTMGGLQHKLVERSQAVDGRAVIEMEFHFQKQSQVLPFIEFLNFQKTSPLKALRAVGEYEAELLLKVGRFLSPVKVHALAAQGERPAFLKGSSFQELALSKSLAGKLGVKKGDLVRVISPAHVDTFLGDIPRTTSLYVDSFFSTDLPEIDQYHIWIDLKKMQNLIRSTSLNKIRLYGDFSMKALKRVLEQNYGGKYRLKTWEEMNQSLVWALQLESSVMIFLFVGMTLLVGLCITSALMIFLDKIKTDLTSFWILGHHEKGLFRATSLFLQALTLLSIGLGVGLGLLFLQILHVQGGEWMPSIFVERKIPVRIEAWGVFISCAVPYFMSILFSYFTLNLFKRDMNYLEQIRSVNP